MHDLILLCEFSETYGPIPLLHIPLENLFTSVDDLVVKIMTIDYHNLYSNIERDAQCEDVQVLRSNVVAGLHVYAHYYNLFDIQARGFVRPMCIAYFSPDYSKLLKYFTVLEHYIKKASTVIKLYNYKLFKEDLLDRLRDLIYTKECLEKEQENYMQNNSKDKKSSGCISRSHNVYLPSQASVDNISDPLQSTSINSLNSQIEYSQIILRYISKFLEEYSSELSIFEEMRSKDANLRNNTELEDAIFGVKSICSPLNSAEPQVFINSQRNKVDFLKCITLLCLYGLLAGLRYLTNLLNYLSRSLLMLSLEEMECDMNYQNSLFLGDVPLVQLEYVRTKAKEFIDCDMYCDYGVLIHLCQFANQLHHSLKCRRRLNNFEIQRLFQSNVVHTQEDECDEMNTETNNKYGKNPDNPDKTSVQATNKRLLLADIYNRISIKDCKNLRLFIQQFPNISCSVIESVLSGRVVVLAGVQYLELLITLYVSALSMFVPRKGSATKDILRWHTGILTKHHLQNYCIIGLCIPQRLTLDDLMKAETKRELCILNLETGNLHNKAYSGHLLKVIKCLSTRQFFSDENLQCSIQAFMIPLGTKVFMIFHLLKTYQGRVPNVDGLLKSIGLHIGDFNIIRNLIPMHR